MHNWDYIKNADFKADEGWYLERLLTYGTNGEKIDQVMLRKNFEKIRIPQYTRKFLALLLWNEPF